jgi:hypothetical protein
VPTEDCGTSIVEVPEDWPIVGNEG